MKQKVVVVTGASSGIGRATAERLLREGYRVYGAARRPMPFITDAGGVALSLDLTKEASITAMAKRVLDAEGRIDGLVNNAGYGAYGAVEDVPLAEARRQFEVNLFGLARLTQCFLPTMRKQRSGRIINVSSIGGRVVTPLGAWYHATKFALEGWSDCLRFELHDFGVDVVVIMPGGVATEWVGIARGGMEQTSAQGAYSGVAQRLERMAERFGTLAPPDAIARVISKALGARRPRTRYIAGTGARPLLFLRWLMGDRAMDWGLRRLTG